jgi:serine/threonine-protein kinase
MAEQDPHAPGSPPAPRRLNRGPLITLAAGVALAAILGGLSANAASNEAGKNAATVAATASGSAPPPSASAPPSATSAPADKLRAAYAGKVNGGGASLAIAVRDGTAIAYLCDGKTEAWLRGTATGGKLNLTGVGSQAGLTGTFDQGSAAGKVTAGQHSYAWDIKVARKPSGLYRSTAQVRNARVVTGWIVLSNGEQVGVSSSDGVQTSAPRLDAASSTATIDGTQVSAQSIDGASGNGF